MIGRSSATAARPSTRCGCGPPPPPTISTFRHSAAAISSAPWPSTLAAESLTRVLYPDDSTSWAGPALCSGVFSGRLLAGRSRAALPARQSRLEHTSRQGRHSAQRHASGDGGAGADADSARRGASRLGRGLGPDATELWPTPTTRCCPKRWRNGRSHGFEGMLPRHLEIIYEINRRFLDDVRTPLSGRRRARRNA